VKRYLVERTYPRGLVVPAGDEGRRACASIVAVDAVCDVTWIRSYVSEDRKKSFCIYVAPSPEAIRCAAERNGLPVSRITEVDLLCPRFGQE
jgi:hypothetical protein